MANQPPTSTIILTAGGLVTQPNELTTQPGSLSEASEIIIRRDNVIEPRRGFALFGEPAGSISDRFDQIIEYKSTILRHYNDILQYDTGLQDSSGQDIFNDFCGSYSNVEPGLRIKSREMNGNLYFTTSTGIQKISATSPNDFTNACGFITPAGGIKALDITTYLDPAATGFLPPDSAVAYRVVWATNDINGNLILGTPSARSVVYNPLQDSIIANYMQTLLALDNVNVPSQSVYTDGNYVSTLGLSLSTPATELQTNLLALVEKLDLEQGTIVSASEINNVSISNLGLCTVTLNNSSIGLLSNLQVNDPIFLNGVWTDSAGLNIAGIYTVSSISLTGVPTAQVVSIASIPGSSFTSTGSADYFTLSSAINAQNYYVWFNVNNSNTNPNVFGYTGLQINVSSTDSIATISSDIAIAINGLTGFTATNDSTSIIVTNNDFGSATAPTNHVSNASFNISVITSGSLGDTISFFTTSPNLGSVSLSGASIQSAWFRAIPQPAIPDSPATNAELVALQTYLQNIITELQTNRNVLISATTTALGITGSYPLLINSASVSGNTNLNISLSSNALDAYLPGDKIFLDGTWIASDSSSLIGYYTINSISDSNNIVIIIPSTANGSVTLASDSNIQLIKRFSTALQILFINSLNTNGNANVTVIIPIPEQVTSNYFFQIYRSNIVTASQTDVLQDLIPDDEMRLVYEAYPTPAEITARVVSVIDIVPQSFFQGGAFLYTDEVNGEGILQADEPPPLAHDINMFKNVMFYANTQTKHSLSISLLGISNIIADFLAGNSPTLTIASSISTNSYKFIVGTQQQSNITVPDGSVFSSSSANYFLINGRNNITKYYVWFYVNGGTDVDPMISGLTGIQVVINSTDSNAVVAQKLTDSLNTIVTDFSASVASNIVTITNIIEGITDSISPATATGTMFGVTGYSASVITPGTGQSITNQTTLVNTIAGNAFTSSGIADYFTLSTAFNRQNYFFWFNVNNGNTNPAISGYTGIEVAVNSTDTAPQVAIELNNAVNNLTNILTSTVNSNIVTIIGTDPGPTVDAVSHVVDGSFTISTTIEGSLDVLLSSNISPSLALQETTQSLVNVINANPAEIVYGFYLSGITDVPGKFLLQERTIQDIPFYVVTNTSLTGQNFNPVLSPEFNITNITTGFTSTLTISNISSLTNNGYVILTDTNSYPILDGLQQITALTNNSFQINKTVLISGNKGAGISQTDAVVSSNEVKPNRIYYSKYLQPEAVPLVNFIDVGAQDKAILRIVPLRDSLFVLKEDGVYRISGEVAPFNLALFDTSYILIAPDSSAIANNIIYGWTTQGIMTLTEGGAQIISRPIDVDILPLASEQYTNFNTATFGIGYNSEYSYLVWTVTNTNDIVATQAYIYNNLTSTWVRWDKTNTSGIVNPIDNKLYLGAGDVNFTEQERKNFDRTDYADRELSLDIELNNYQIANSQLKFFQLSNINNISVGDVITQDQTISIYDFGILLQHLDNDPDININYSVSNVSFDSVSMLVGLTLLDPNGNAPDFINYMSVGDSIIVSNINPIAYNGIYQIDSFSSNTIFYKNVQNPGTWLNNTNGQVNYSYYNTFNPLSGTSLRTSLENLAAQLTKKYVPGLIGIPYDYSRDIGDYLFSNVSVSSTNPAVFTMPGDQILSINVGSNYFSTSSVSFIDGQLITFDTTGTFPSPLTSDSLYYARNTTSSTFQISLTPSSSVLSLSNTYTGILSSYAAHGLLTGRYIQVSNSTTVPNINNNYTVLVINRYQFSINISVSTPGTASFETLINDFNDIRGSFNIIIQDLNVDPNVAFKNYIPVLTNTLFETPISDINYVLKDLQIQYVLPFIVGPITIYKAINSSFEYTPITMNDSLSLKHFREATIMYLNKTFTTAEISFASDLLPELISVPVAGLGAGLYGNDPNGENYYGGNSNSAPFRTIIPLVVARGRFLRIEHSHSVAREKYSILGTSITGRITSTRAYR